MKQEEWTKEWWGDDRKEWGEPREERESHRETDERFLMTNYQTGYAEMNDSKATSVAGLYLTLSNLLKEVYVSAYNTTSTWLSAFVAVVMQCELLEALTLNCMSFKHFSVLFFTSFTSIPLLLFHFFALIDVDDRHFQGCFEENRTTVENSILSPERIGTFCTDDKVSFHLQFPSL